MTWFSKWINGNKYIIFILATVVALLIGGFFAWTSIQNREQERLELLVTSSERLLIEVLSETLNSNLLGGINALGIIDNNIKLEVENQLEPNNLKVFSVLKSIGLSYKSDGVFVVSQNGIITSSWDSQGKPSTGLNVEFRPYYIMAKQGIENIYAAVSIAKGVRSIYFSAPVFKENSNQSEAIGAVVARTTLDRVDQLISEKTDIVLLVSPQGVVFASNQKAYIGHLTHKLTNEELTAVRALKQFGKAMESEDIKTINLPTTTGIHHLDNKRLAVSEVQLEWNDPSGPWKIVMIEDLGRTVDSLPSIQMGLWSFGIAFTACYLLLNTFRFQANQKTANLKLEAYANEQAKSAESKSRMAEISVKLQQSKTVERLLKQFLSESHTLFGTLQGAIYLIDDVQDNQLRLAGSYACETLPNEVIDFGEGLVGQCALDKKMMILRVGDQGMTMIRSGLGEHSPESMVIAPILLNETVLGVVEIALLKSLSELEQNAFKELLTILAMNIEILGRSSRTDSLIAAMKAVERATEEQLYFQQVLIDTIPYPVFYKDAETRFLGVNKAYEDSFGVRREQLIGKRIVEVDVDYISETDAIAFQAEDEALIASSSSLSREIQLKFGDGTLHDLIYSASGFLNSQGKPAGLIGTNIDITEIKQARRDLKRLMDAEALNSLVKDRETSDRFGEAANESNDTQSILATLFNDYCDALGVGAALIDIDGHVIMASSWQSVCADFHRSHPDSCSRCIESDTEMVTQLDEGATYTLYSCKNGMTDAGAPILMDGKHVANIFVGQFHIAQPDLSFFKAQAIQYGYDESAYLEAVSKASVIETHRVPAILHFLKGFSHIVLENQQKERRS